MALEELQTRHPRTASWTSPPQLHGVLVQYGEMDGLKPAAEEKIGDLKCVRLESEWMDGWLSARKKKVLPRG